MKRLHVLLAVLVGVASLGATNLIGNLIRLHATTLASLPAASTLNAGALVYLSESRQMALSNSAEWLRLQPALATSDIGCVMPGSGTGLTNFGIVVSTVGTISNTGGVTGFGLPSTLHRVIAATSSAADQSAEFFTPQANLFFGNLAGNGGFSFRARFWIQGTAPTRVFIGLAGTAAALPAADPNALLNTIYVGANAADTNLSICSNDAAGTATCTTLGASFPAVSSLLVYDVFLYSAPNTSTVYYMVNSVNSSTVTSGTLSADLPANTTFLAPHVWANNASSGLAVNLHLSRYCTSRQF